MCSTCISLYWMVFLFWQEISCSLCWKTAVRATLMQHSSERSVCIQFNPSLYVLHQPLYLYPSLSLFYLASLWYHSMTLNNYKKLCNANNHAKDKVFFEIIYPKKGFKEDHMFQGCSLFFHGFTCKATQQPQENQERPRNIWFSSIYFYTYYFPITLTSCNTLDVSVTHIFFGVQIDGSFLMSHLNFKLLNTVVV